jgi:stearoyl-CoA desaturase (Delta-9 desaturase)
MTAIEGMMPEHGADRKMPPGVLVEGPVVDAKFAIPMSRSAS